MIDGIETWNEPDARAYSRLYADDADLTTVIGTTAHGPAAIDAHNAKVFENLFKRDLYCQFGFVPEIGWRGK